MTRDELHTAFKVEMDKNSMSSAFGGYPAFIDSEIDYWINKGYYNLLMQKFTGNTSNEIEFEGDVKRIADFERLIRTDEDVELTKKSNSNCVYLENLLNRETNNRGRMFYVSAIFHWTKDDITHSATVELQDHDTIKKFIRTHDNNPWIENPGGVIENNKLIIYYDPISMNADSYSIDITYVKHPCLINDLPADEALSELPDQVWYEVINRAVLMALENIESDRREGKQNLIDSEE